MRASEQRKRNRAKLKELMESAPDPEALAKAIREHATSRLMLPRCNGTTRSGEQCKRAPLAGMTVCAFHGGSAPHIKNLAKQRLLAMTEPAFAVLMEVMEGEADDDTRLKAALGVLDRAGYGPRSTITVDHRKEELASLTDEQIAARMQDLLTQMQANALPVIDINLEEQIAQQKALPLPFPDEPLRSPLEDPQPTSKGPSRVPGVVEDEPVDR